METIPFSNQSDISLNISSVTGNVYNFTDDRQNNNLTKVLTEEGFVVKNLHLLKAIVLCVVVVILIVSACKFVLKTFSKYVEAEQKEDM